MPSAFAPGPKGGGVAGTASVHTWGGLRMPKWQVERREEAIEVGMESSREKSKV